MERDNAYAVTGGSLLPSDICTRLYGALQRKRAEKGKPIALTIPMRIERGEHLIGRDTSHKFGRVITLQKAVFRVDIAGEHLGAWLKVTSKKKFKGERIMERIQLREFLSGEVHLLEERTKVNLTPGRLKIAASLSGVLGTVAAFTSWIPGIAETSIILGVASSTLLGKYTRIGMKTECGSTYLEGEIRQDGWYLMDAILNAPDWALSNGKAEAPPPVTAPATP